MATASTHDVLLRDVTESDFQAFFEHQLDPVAGHMAAFTVKDPTDREAFMARWAMIWANAAVTKKTIVADGHVAGHILSFDQFGKPSVSYWIGKDFWGRGIATRALAEFLRQFKTRPLHARAAKDNVASLRVLQKCGFSICGEDKGFSEARGVEVEEFILELPAT